MSRLQKVTGTNKDETATNTPKKRTAAKVYPNDPCPCGSGKNTNSAVEKWHKILKIRRGRHVYGVIRKCGAFLSSESSQKIIDKNGLFDILITVIITIIKIVKDMRYGRR